MTKKGNENSPATDFLGLSKKVTELVKSESDRGAILILAAYLEEILGLLVRAVCISDKHGQNLTELNKPAGNFDSKIIFCVSLGLISEDEEKALRFVQKIRNRAAHFDKRGRGFDVLFDSNSTVDQVAEFVKLFQSKLISRKPEKVKWAFVLSCRLLSSKLYVRLAKVSRMQKPCSSSEESANFLEKIKDTEVGKYLATMKQEASEGELEKLNKVLNSFQEIIKYRHNGNME